MYRYVIKQSPRGYEIYINLITSPAGAYLSRRPYVINLIKEVLAAKNLSKPHTAIEHDMGRNIGTTDIIETSEKDIIYYAQQYKTSVYSRYAKNRYPSPSHVLSIIIERDDDGNYEVCDTWIGPCSPPFPGDSHEAADSKAYWETHALAQDLQTVQSKTITRLCPY
jgi:hypothetical protein